MSPDPKTAQIFSLLEQDAMRLLALSHFQKIVTRLDLADAWIAAGFVRNLVWDALHGYAATPLNDIDVIYFDTSDQEAAKGLQAEADLQALAPAWIWQVKNQALMHSRNQDPPYLSSEDAMRYWPEQETAVAVRLNANAQLECLAPFGLQSLFAGQLTPNPRRSAELFASRLRAKNWLSVWPDLQVSGDFEC